MEKIRRPALRYHGGKWRIAPWIMSHFPPHTCYVEPFGGAGSVLLRKPPAFVEVYNDLNGDIVNFFRVLRERPAELIAAIDLTPYSRDEFIHSQEVCCDSLERARRFYVWSWQGRGRAGVREVGGWRFMSRNKRSQSPVHDWNNYNHLWAIVQRLKQVHIECGEAISVIKRYDGERSLFYVDPPYVQSVRGERWQEAAYVCEYWDEDHIKLAQVLHGIDGMVIVSGYRSELYDDLFGDWVRVDREERKDNNARVMECLWLSPQVMEARLPLFRWNNQHGGSHGVSDYSPITVE